MKGKRIIYISIIGFLSAAAILTNIMDIQNKEYVAEDAQLSKIQLKEDEATATLFKYLPVNGWSDEDAKP